MAAAFAAVLVAASLGLTSGASADQGTPSAGAVASAKSKAASVATRVGIMQAELAQDQAKLASLGVQIDSASEAYDGAVYRLQQAQAQAGLAQQAAARAHAGLVAAQQAVGRLAAAAYQNGGMTLGIGAVMSATSPGGALDALSSLSALGRQQTATLNQMQASRIVADVMNKQARAALTVVSRDTAAAAAARSTVQSEVRTQTAAIAALTVKIATLTTQLNALRSQSTQLTRARAAGLARAAAARAAAERESRQHSSGSTGSTGPGSSSIGSGSGPIGGGGNYGGPNCPDLPPTTAAARAAVAYACAQIGKPYVYAAAGPNAFDCSGLTMMAWRQGGVNLPHWSVAQWELSTPVSAAQVRPGDLVFYATNPANVLTVHHVAIYIGYGLMVEAPHTGAFVRIAPVHGESDFFAFGRV